MPMSLPFVIAIQVYQADGSTARANASLKITNQTTGDTDTFTANVNGQAIYDAGNLESGYSDGDKIKIEEVSSDDNTEYFVTGNGGATKPTWVQCNNNTRTKIPLNTYRFKMDQTRRAGGFDINISKSS